MKTLLCGNNNLSKAQKTDILIATVRFVLSFMRFEENLY